MSEAKKTKSAGQGREDEVLRESKLVMPSEDMLTVDFIKDMSERTYEYSTMGLPSGGLQYENKVNTWEIRPMSVPEQAFVSEINDTNYYECLFKFLNAVSRGHFNIGKLTRGDFQQLLLWSKVKTGYANHTLEFDCVKCNKPTVATFNLSLMKTKMWTKEDGDYTEPLYLEGLKKKVKLHLLTNEDYITVDKFLEEYPNKKRWTAVYAQSIDLGSPTNLMFRYNFCDTKIPLEDFEAIRAYHTKFDYGPIRTMEYTCTRCGGVGLFPVPFRADIFINMQPKLNNENVNVG